jgi:manganese transport protein
VFCVGYTLGTGGVGRLFAAGAELQFQLLWVLPLGALLFYTLMEGMGRYAAVSGGTALYGFRTQLRGGRILALLIIAGVVLGQWTALPVLVRLVAQLVSEGARILVPSVPAENPWVVIAVAAILLAGVFMVLTVGRYSLLEKVMMSLVTLMLGGFIGAAFLTALAPEGIAGGLIQAAPAAHGDSLAVLGLVGTAIAAPTILMRSLLVSGKGWSIENATTQRRDAALAAAIILVLGVAVMACAAGSAAHQGSSTWNISDAVRALEAHSGRFAAGLFALGAICAGLSSIIPIVMILPVLISDYRTGELQIQTRHLPPLVALACAAGLAGAVFGDQLTILHRTASQCAQVFVLPLVVGGATLLLNSKELMGVHKAGFWLNAGLAAALAYSFGASWRAIATLAKSLG